MNATIQPNQKMTSQEQNGLLQLKSDDVKVALNRLTSTLPSPIVNAR
jgi:hypothetical protein